jgi:hypothetical protein
MITKVAIDNFRGKNIVTELSPSCLISGKNKSGKTTIKEAICFAFTGKDSAGSGTIPTHLISVGSDKLRVEVVTTKVTITRTLTQNRNSTLRIVREGSGGTLTQAEFEKAFCTSDLFLSIFVPGFFMKLAPSKKQQVLSEACGAIDRKALLAELFGGSVDDFVHKYGIDKRPDLIANAVAQDRRTYERDYASISGQRNAYLSAISEASKTTEPMPPEDFEDIAYFDTLKRAWNEYDMALVSYNAHESQRQRIIESNKEKEIYRKTLEEQISNIIVPEVPPVEILDLTLLQSRLRALPPEPSYTNVVESEHCPYCGQIVGSKHKEKLKEENEKKKKEWEAAIEDTRIYNQGVLDEIGRTKIEHEQRTKVVSGIRMDNSKKSQIKMELEAKRKATMPAPEMAPMDNPIPPENPYIEEDHELIKEKMEVYHAKHYHYKKLMEQKADAEKTISELDSKHALLSDFIARQQRYEDALKRLPEEELKRKAEAVAIPSFKTVITDDIGLENDNGAPYALFSAGETIKADIELSVKLAMLTNYKVDIIFVDNADLVDTIPYEAMKNMQVMAANVTNGDLLISQLA